MFKTRYCPVRGLVSCTVLLFYSGDWRTCNKIVIHENLAVLPHHARISILFDSQLLYDCPSTMIYLSNIGCQS